ncbi:MAG: T9SS type B sorting domain-containing protein [Chlorobi bacterium]|nr:T9SS type B sorting domain-containing protein [Chlorobiota bacterium]
MANFYLHSLYLFDFDINTGHTSNQVSLPMPSGFKPYGVEFSPSGEILYVKGTNESENQAYILQYDLNNTPYQYNIIASQSGYRGALQLGIDGRIYVAESQTYDIGRNYISTINNPDQLGSACNFQYRSMTMANNAYSRQGLPQFIQTFFVQIQTENVCVDEEAHFLVSSNVDIGSVNWDFGDGNTATTPPVQGNPQQAEATHTYSTAGTYNVQAEIITVNNDTSHIQTNIEIYPLPRVDSIPNIEVCDTAQNGLTTLRLHDYDANITTRQTYPGTYTVEYYTSQSDAEAQTNPIQDPYTTTTPYDQTVWFSVENTVTECSNVGHFHIIVHPLPEIYTVPDLEVCDEDDDGMAEFTLEDAEPDILNGRNAADYTITYYASQADAEAQTNPITSPYTNTTPHQQTVYYVIRDNQYGCYNIGSFNLVVHPKPVIDMDDSYMVCQNDSVYVEAPSGFVAYQWSTGATTRGIYIYSGGDYTVTVTDNFGCSNSKTIHVDESGPATIESIETVDFNGSDNSITVYVSGNGDYEYSLDDVNYQDSNRFEGLYPGTYTVYVRDKNGCGTVSAIVDLLGAPQYFTPNGDGTHEYWQVINVQRLPGTTVYIYNRYGLLLKQFTDADPGWDGTYNGVPQPSDDYWYVVKLPSGRIVKGHFSLIR